MKPAYFAVYPVLFTLLSGITGAGAQETQKTTDSSTLPIDVEADTGTYDQLAGLAVYSGNVKVNQGVATIWAHKLTVILKHNTAERLEAEGNSKAPVRFEYKGNKQPIVGKGEKVVYTVVDKIVTLSGNAVVQQGQDIIKGNQLTYNLQKEVIGGSRVKMTFLPGNK
ncbi:MAG: lipopolysaccharide transport periplasmic protein LptA [Gammaproteobacteria bacterium]|nr:MAG: lipopolysaccharide transport periplasmic protein LptA [Gammaproteobacteria bacterium]